MGLFEMLGGKSMDTYVAQAKDEGIVLVDVRERDEFASGHVEGSANLPLSELPAAASVLVDKSATYYVYCLSGARSSRATAALKAMGYANVTNIGGVRSYSGALVAGE